MVRRYFLKISGVVTTASLGSLALVRLQQLENLRRKRAPHHLFTLPDGSGGGVYLDPVATDDFPFKVFVHQHGQEIVARAIANPSLARNSNLLGCDKALPWKRPSGKTTWCYGQCLDPSAHVAKGRPDVSRKRR